MKFIYKSTFLFLLYLSGCGYAPMFTQNPLPSTPKNIEDGRALYVTHCLMCHGQDGVGNGILSKNLNVSPADLTKLPLFPKGFIEFSIKTGGDTDIMPAWENKLTELEIFQLGIYLRSIQQ